MTNLVLLIADQFRAPCLEPGGDPVPTPHLDRLATQGVDCRGALSSQPVCSPHRAMLITGQPPSENGVPINVNSKTAARGVSLRSDAESWAKVMADHGMHTGWIGKWHLEAPTAEDETWGEGRRGDGIVWDAYSPPDRRFGFRTWYSHGCCDDHLHPHYWEGDAGREARIDVDQWSAEHETDRAIDFFDAHGAGPFALAVSWNPPHPPFDGLPHGIHEQFAGRGQALLTRPNVPEGVREEAGWIAERYFTAVWEIDRQVGRIMEALEQRGLTEDTVLIFTSDHGEQLGSQGLFAKNVPFEESMRIPLLVSHPASLPPGRSDVLMGSLDYAPTLLGLVGLGDAIPERMVGKDLSPALRAPRHGGGHGDGNLGVPFFHEEADEGGLTQRGVRTATHMWVLSEKAGEVWSTCHDLRSDPYQLRPLDSPGTDRELAEQTRELLVDLGMPWPVLEEYLASAR